MQDTDHKINPEFLSVVTGLSILPSIISISIGYYYGVALLAVSIVTYILDKRFKFIRNVSALSDILYWVVLLVGLAFAVFCSVYKLEKIGLLVLTAVGFIYLFILYFLCRNIINENVN